MWRLETRDELAPGERDEILRLVADAQAVDGFRPLSDHHWLDLLHGGRDDYAAVLARADTPDGALIGYAQLGRGADGRVLEIVVHPDHRSELLELGSALVAAALDWCADHGGGRVHWWAFRPDERAQRIADACALRPGRRLLQMRRPLPLEADQTPGLATRPFEVGRDEAAWLEVNNAAFAHHPEQGAWDLDTLRQREREPWFDPAGFLLHERDGRLAGFCWTKVHADETPPLGEIYVIAVHPDHHSRGLGRALTTAGLHSLAERGLRHAMLHVDAGNTAAVALYERLGFTVHHVDCAYVTDVAPRPARGGCQ